MDAPTIASNLEHPAGKRDRVQTADAAPSAAMNAGASPPPTVPTATIVQPTAVSSPSTPEAEPTVRPSAPTSSAHGAPANEAKADASSSSFAVSISRNALELLVGFALYVFVLAKSAALLGPTKEFFVHIGPSIVALGNVTAPLGERVLVFLGLVLMTPVLALLLYAFAKAPDCLLRISLSGETVARFNRPLWPFAWTLHPEIVKAFGLNGTGRARKVFGVTVGFFFAAVLLFGFAMKLYPVDFAHHLYGVVPTDDKAQGLTACTPVPSVNRNGTEMITIRFTSTRALVQRHPRAEVTLLYPGSHERSVVLPLTAASAPVRLVEPTHYGLVSSVRCAIASAESPAYLAPWLSLDPRNIGPSPIPDTSLP